MSGFYVPGSSSSSYVASKKNEEGGYVYESAANQVSIQKQTAIQQLEKNYASTIENAYASYLAANRGVQGSQMGQGYKELYKQVQQQQLQANVANTASEFRQQVANIEAQEASAQQQIQQQFQTEVSYFDRLRQSMADYFEYAKALTDSDGNGYFDPYELNQSVDSMYNILGSAQPIGQYDAEGNYIGYADTEGKAGMTYSEWIANQMGTSKDDQAWYQWFLGGGYNEFMNAPKETRQWQPGELKKIREAEIAQAQAEKEREDLVATINSANTDMGIKINTSTLTNALIKAGIPKDNINVLQYQSGDYDWGKGQRMLAFDYTIKADKLSEEAKKILEETGFKVSKDKDGNTVYTNTYRERTAKNAEEFFAR